MYLIAIMLPRSALQANVLANFLAITVVTSPLHKRAGGAALCNRQMTRILLPKIVNRMRHFHRLCVFSIAFGLFVASAATAQTGSPKPESWLLQSLHLTGSLVEGFKRRVWSSTRMVISIESNDANSPRAVALNMNGKRPKSSKVS